MTYTAQEIANETEDLKVGDTTAANQDPSAPDFLFAGGPQKGTKNRLQDKKILIYGGGDVWPKFIRSPLLHLGIKPENITIVDLNPKPKGLEWQYEGMNFIQRETPDSPLNGDPDYIKKQNFDFAIVATPPSAHESCAKEAIENGLPVMIEKPIFSSTAEYDKFASLCEEKNAHVYAIDWQRALSTPLYATLGQTVPFSDSIEYKDGQDKKVEDGSLFQKHLANDEVEDVRAIFTEGRGNALADIRHRGHLLKALKEGKWACAGMLADMGIHPINAITGAGFTLNKITGAFFGGASDEQGYREAIPHSREEGAESEMFARVDTEMSWGKQGNIPVHFECGKGSAPNVNDGRTIFKFKSGKILVQEFGARVNRITLYTDDTMKDVLATASDRGEPYERMFLEASHLFDKWSESAKDQARIAYGVESREALELIEKSHQHACEYPPEAGAKMRQYALDEMGEQKDVGEKAAGFKVEKIEEYRTISPEEVIAGSCQRHSTAEGVTFDQKSGCFYYVDIEHGLLTRYNPNAEERTTWKLTSDELDVDGRPKQMLSVAKVNQDGSVMVMLSGGGENAGLNYFNPETGVLKNVGNIPAWEVAHLDNRPNDETTLTIGGKNYICYGTMNKHWNKKFDANSQLQRTGAYYLVDPVTNESHPLTFEEGKYPAPLITNGLADGGDTKDGRKILFWSETVEDAGGKGGQLNVYRGVLDPTTYKVSDIEIFKKHEELGGMMNGTDTYGRPDGAKMGMYHNKPVYGISVLELGQIRFFYSDKNDPDYYQKEALRIELPKGMTRNTQFALGEDNGKPIGVVTTQDSGYFDRRWQVPKDSGDKPDKAKDGLNGSVIRFDLPDGLTMHPQAVGRVKYKDMDRVLSTDPYHKITIPGETEKLTPSSMDGSWQNEPRNRFGNRISELSLGKGDRRLATWEL